MLVELGHFEAALDEISDWTSRTGKQLAGIGHGDNDQTDLAKLELLQADLGSKKVAIEKLKPKLEDFPAQDKRFNTVVDNLEKEKFFDITSGLLSVLPVTHPHIKNFIQD